MPSLSARVVRPMLGLASRRLAPGIPVAEQRATLERLLRLTRRPRGVAFAERPLGDVPAIRATPTGDLPGRNLLWFHGGAFVVGSAEASAGVVGRLAAATASTAWLVDYRLAPEHPHPAAVEDGVAAYEALADQLGAQSIVLAGDSAGGGVALATLHAIRDAGLPMPAGAVLLSPWLDLTLSGPSVRDAGGHDGVLRSDWLEEAANGYAGSSRLEDVSPLFGDHRGLPPLLVFAGGAELLRSDSEAMAAAGRAAGVEVRLVVEPGLWHVYPLAAPLVPEATTAQEEIRRFVGAVTAS